MRPTRRQFLAIAPAAALTAVAPAGSGRSRSHAPHDARLAAQGLCDCLGCDEANTRRASDPLVAAALVAFYGAGDRLLTLRRAHGCPDREDCQLCTDARLVSSILGVYECGLEGELIFSRCPDLARRCGESERLRNALAAGRLPPLPPKRGKNHPAHEPAVLALYDLRDALEPLLDGHDCRGDCYVCEQVEHAAYLVPGFIAALEHTFIPTVRTLRRAGVSPEHADLLDLLDLLERAEARAAAV